MLASCELYQTFAVRARDHSLLVACAQWEHIYKLLFFALSPASSTLRGLNHPLLLTPPLNDDMADPIEIIQTVISVSQQIYGIVKSIKGAPDELKTIDRAVSRILPILKHLVETLGNRVREEDRDPDAAALRSLCDEARELVEVAKGFLGSRNDGTFKLRKKEWPRWLMKKSDREDLAKRFHDLHGAISSYLS